MDIQKSLIQSCIADCLTGLRVLHEESPEQALLDVVQHLLDARNHILSADF